MSIKGLDLQPGDNIAICHPRIPMPNGLTTSGNVAEPWRRSGIRVSRVDYDLMRASAKVLGPRHRRRARAFSWTGRPYSSSDSVSRQGDFLLTPYGPLVFSRRAERGLSRRSSDGVYQYVGRGELALDEDGIQVITAHGNALSRTTFDGGTTGWTVSAGVTSETTADGARFFDAAVEDTNLLITQANPAAADRYVYQNIAWGYPGTSPVTADVGIAHLDSVEGLEIRVQRTSDGLYNVPGTTTWAALNPGVTGYVTPARTSVPTFDWAPFDFSTAGAETFRIWFVSPAGGTASRTNRLYYAEQHTGVPYPMCPHQKTASLQYGNGRSTIWVPNYASARTFPADHGTFSIWVLPFWDFADDFVSGMTIQTDFGVFNVFHDDDNSVACHVDALNGDVIVRWRAGGTDYEASISPAAFGRESGWQNITVRWIGTEGELGLTPYTVDVFVGGVKGTSVVAEALVEDDHSIMTPGAWTSAAYDTMDYSIYMLNGRIRDIDVFYDCLTDEEIAAIAASGGI